MIQCRRLGYAVLSTNRLREQVVYFANVLGLCVVHQDDKRAVLATRHGLECIVLEDADEPGLTGLSFEIDPNISLDQVRESLGRMGVESEIRPSKAAKVGPVVAFNDPKGSNIELFNRIAFAEADREDRGVGIIKLGHIAHYVENVAAVVDFYVSVLGFRKSDWIGELAVFLRCGPDHHTVNFFKSPSVKLNHLAFEVKDFSDLVRASDLLVRNDFPLEWGPARHMVGHNCASYHFNPDNLRIELFAEMDQMRDEALGYFDPRPWHQDRPQRPKDWSELNPVRNQWIPSAPWTRLEEAKKKIK